MPGNRRRREKGRGPSGVAAAAPSTAGLSQEVLAERAGLSKRGISDLERGLRQAPYLATIRRLAEALDLPEPERAMLLAASRRAGAPTAEPTPTEPPAPHRPGHICRTSSPASSGVTATSPNCGACWAAARC